MKLHDLLFGIIDDLNFPNVKVNGITSDSRRVKPGYLFVALSAIGNSFISAAITSGAVAIIGDLIRVGDNVILISNRSPKKIYHKIAARFYPRQPENIVSVTGTNGKTSVVTFCKQLWDSVGIRSASIGTLGVSCDFSKNYATNLTTPDSADMHYLLNYFASCNISHVAVEASSHGLDQYRMHSVKLKAAAFTNLSHDHYDYHTDYNSYFQAKIKLFTEILQKGGAVVLNSDIYQYKGLLDIVGERNVISYGQNVGEIRLIKQIPHKDGQTIYLEISDKREEIFVPILGAFQAYNIMCAVGLVMAVGLKDFNLGALRSSKGRMELLENNGKVVVIDYAHTPEALKSALISLRWHNCDKRIILVFGCGGDRDKSKRRVMGDIAQNYADKVIVCDDNPRTENPALIRQDIISRCRKAVEIGDRSEAIISAICQARQQDVILIAGKGHEDYQLKNGIKNNLSDFAVVRNELF